jgi:ATP-binding protein involved in chromosome partitioning
MLLPPLVPHRISRRREGLLVEWQASGPATLYPARALRLACPCAACVEEMSGRSLLNPASVPEDVWPMSIELVGAYGLRIRWSDGHDTGIYTFEQLRRG